MKFPKIKAQYGVTLPQEYQDVNQIIDYYGFPQSMKTQGMTPVGQEQYNIPTTAAQPKDFFIGAPNKYYPAPDSGPLDESDAQYGESGTSMALPMQSTSQLPGMKFSQMQAYPFVTPQGQMGPFPATQQPITEDGFQVMPVDPSHLYSTQDVEDVQKIFDAHGAAGVNQAQPMQISPKALQQGKVTPGQQVVNAQTGNTDPMSGLIDDYEAKMEDIGKEYFAGQKAYGVSSLIHNIMQPEPPSRVSKNISFGRLKTDITPFLTASAKAQEAATRSARAMRETSGQMSDFLKGTQSIQATTEMNERNIAAQMAQALNQERMINLQTAQKKDQINQQVFNADVDFNLRQKDAHHKHKADAISKSLAMLSQTYGHQARFAADTAYASTQSRIMEQHRQDQAKMDKAALLLQHSQGFRDSEMYTTALNKEKMDFMSKNKERVIKEGYIPYEGKLEDLEKQLNMQESYVGGLLTESMADLPESPGDRPTIDKDTATPEELEIFNTQESEWLTKNNAYAKAEANKARASKAYGPASERYKKMKEDYEKSKTGQQMLTDWWKNSGLVEKFDKSFKEKYGYRDLIDLAGDFPSIYNGLGL